ncbi:MAG: hypothetical protein EYC69_00620 [Bacteroidetes bacterium]|nr:MAG: hypothetical protein EYC69_00620 [Bacteroidota bacterium]
MITRANYEQYFLDFHEASLDASDEKALFIFLDQNPDLREEFESFVSVQLEPDFNVSFNGKDALRKSFINEHNYISRLVAYLENDLDDAAKHSVEIYIKNNPAFVEELEILRKTKIQPDHSIVFAGKYELKKETKVIYFRKLVYRATAIAAALIILLLSYFAFVNSRQERIFVEEKSNPDLPVTYQVQNPSGQYAVNKDGSEQERKMANVKAVSNLASRSKNKTRSNNFHNPSSPAQELIDPSVPVIENIAFESQIVFNDKRDSVRSEVNPSIAENTIVPGTATEFQIGELSTVFSQEELAEFGLIPTPAGNSGSLTAWDIAEAGVEKLATATGAKVELDRYDNHIKNATTYALEIGRFSVSRTRVK